MAPRYSRLLTQSPTGVGGLGYLLGASHVVTGSLTSSSFHRCPPYRTENKPCGYTETLTSDPSLTLDSHKLWNHLPTSSNIRGSHLGHSRDAYSSAGLGEHSMSTTTFWSRESTHSHRAALLRSASLTYTGQQRPVVMNKEEAMSSQSSN